MNLFPSGLFKDDYATSRRLAFANFTANFLVYCLLYRCALKYLAS